MKNMIKESVAVTMMACMLLTMVSVSSNAETDIMTCGFTVETEVEELD